MNVVERTYDWNAEQHREHLHVKAGQNARWRYDVPTDATPGRCHTIAIYPHDDGTGASSSPVNGCVKFTTDPDDFGGPYEYVAPDVRIQIAGGEPRPGYHQVAPGSTFYVTATLAHGDKAGQARSGKEFAIANELRK